MISCILSPPLGTSEYWVGGDVSLYFLYQRIFLWKYFPSIKKYFWQKSLMTISPPNQIWFLQGGWFASSKKVAAAFDFIACLTNLQIFVLFCQMANLQIFVKWQIYNHLLLFCLVKWEMLQRVFVIQASSHSQFRTICNKPAENLLFIYLFTIVRVRACEINVLKE